MADDVVAELDAELALIEELPYRVPIHLLARRARDEIVALREMREVLIAINDETRNDALEEAAAECERHAKFCKDEAHKGGDWTHLITRSEEATYNAKCIRALKEKRDG